MHALFMSSCVRRGIVETHLAGRVAVGAVLPRPEWDVGYQWSAVFSCTSSLLTRATRCMSEEERTGDIEGRHRRPEVCLRVKER